MTTIEPSPRTPLPDRSSSRRQSLHSSDCWIARASANSRCSMTTGTSRLAAFLENACVPFGSIGQLFDPALVGIRSILKLAQLEDRGSDLARKFLLLASIPLDPSHHFAAFIIESLEQVRKYQFPLFSAARIRCL